MAPDAGALYARAMRDRVAPWLLPALLGAVSAYGIFVGDLFPDPPAPKAVMIVNALFVTVPLRWRKEAPETVLALVIAGSLFGWVWSRGSGGLATVESWLACLIAFYSVGAYAERRRGLIASGLAWVVVLEMAVADTAAGFQSVGDYLGTFGFLAAAWAVGNSAGSLRGRGTELERRAMQAEREREEGAHLAVAEERARIARELHDVVAHAVSTMVIQAGGARQLVRSDPDDAEQALRAAERTGRDALREMRRLVGLLRDRDEQMGLAPQPSLAQVEQLVAQSRAAGVAVELRIEGESRHVGAGIDLAAYRIVQEALTNTLKHAGEARVWITISYGARGLDIDVRDDGRTPASDGRNGGGHGLVGMRERASLYGGTLAAGPDPDGGFHVQAHLPLDSIEAS